MQICTVLTLALVIGSRALPRATASAPPLGQVAVDLDAVRLSASLPQVHCLDAVHAWEHSLEVQLPFLQEKLADFKVPRVIHVMDQITRGPTGKIQRRFLTEMFSKD